MRLNKEIIISLIAMAASLVALAWQTTDFVLSKMERVKMDGAVTREKDGSAIELLYNVRNIGAKPVYVDEMMIIREDKDRRYAEITPIEKLMIDELDSGKKASLKYRFDSPQ